jgi:hypothetical protein
MSTVPVTLNGFNVIHSVTHDNGYSTVMVKRDDNDYVVATWAPMLGHTWAWGDYLKDYSEAGDSFNKTCVYNDKRRKL